MAEISLRVYQHQIDNLLKQNKFNEVIAHCRHILKTFPKNMKAYSQLGQALLSASRWDEAAEVFRRLLGSSPHDFVAHASLSQIYQKLEKYDDAIWHAERAFDQQPNNGEIIEQIRTLYREHRGKEVKRLQLTAGAVAQQHLRNELYPQAVAVLDKALQRYPNRIDLQILRARALWLMGKQLDSAEVAVDVLSQLPYSLTANRILTDLWLAEQRPSDAQRYLSRIEDLDPYLAYRLATGETPPESLVELEELDYESLSRRELTAANPDWLSTIGAMDALSDDDADDSPDDVDMDDFIDLLDEEDASAQPMKVTDDLENLLSDEWQERVDALDDGESALSDDDLNDLFGDDDDDLGDLFGNEDDLDDLFSDVESDASPTQEDDLDDLFSEIESAASSAEDDVDLDDLFDEDDNIDLDDLFGSLDDEPEEQEKRLDTDELRLPEGMHTDDLPDGLMDRLEKMKGMSKQETMPASNMQPPPESESTGLTGLLNTLDDDEEEDLSWLVEAQKSNLDTGELTLPDEFADKIPDAPDEIDSDWLQELEEIETSPDAQRASTGLTGMFDADDDDMVDLFGDEDELSADTPEEPVNPDDPMAWMIESGIEFDADAERENIFDLEDEDEDIGFQSAEMNPMAWLGGDDDSDVDESFESEDLDPMAWMNESDDEDAPLAQTGDFSDEAQSAAEAQMPKFFDDVDDDALATNDLAGADAPPLPDDLFGDDSMLDEMLSLEDDDTDFGFEAQDADDGSLDFAVGDDDSDDDEEFDLGFDTDDDSDDDEEFNLRFDADDEEESESDFFDSMDMTEGDASDDDDLDFSADDILAEAVLSAPEDGQEPMNDDFNKDWQDDNSDEDLDSMAWLGDDDDESDDDLPNLLDGAGDGEDEEVDLEDMFAQMAEDDDFEVDESGLEWLQGEELAESADEVDLSFDSDDEEEAELDPMAWMNETDDDTEDAGEAELDPMAWLSGEDVELEASDEGTGMTDMLASLEDGDDESALDAASDVMPNFFDDDSEVEEEAEETGGHWLDNVDLSDTGSAEAVDDEPEADWLSEIENTGEFEEEAEEEIDWLSANLSDDAADDGDDASDDLFNFDDDEEEAEEFSFDTDSLAAVDEPEWLTDFEEATGGMDAITDEELEDDTEADWMADAGEFEGDDDDEAVVDQPDWLSEMNAQSDDDDEDDMEDFLGAMEFDDDEDTEDDPVMEQPDWLSGVSRDDDGEGDDEAVETTDDWLSDLGEFEEAEDEFIVTNDAGEAVAEDDSADWLSEMDGIDTDEGEDAVAEEDGADWLADIGGFEDEDDAEAQPSVTDELDWMAEDDEDDEPIAAQTDGADWLADMDEFEDEDDAEAQPSVTDELDWMAEDDEFGEETAVGATADVDFLEDVDPATAESALDWMADDEDDEELILDDLEEEPAGITDWLTGGDDDEPEPAGEGAAVGDEWLADIGGFDTDESAMAMAEADGEETDSEQTRDWLSSIGGYEDGDEEFDFEEDDTIAGMPVADDEPDWLADMGEGDGVQDAFDDDNADDLDWSEDSDDLVAEAQAEDEPDWLADLGEGDGVQDVFDEETPENSGALAGLSAINDYETEDELDVTYEEEALPTFEEATAETSPSSSVDMGDFEEELEHTPADSAPDWLNAMVPGLDNNFELQDDDPLDEVLIDEQDTKQPEKGFDWLNDIVEEETGAMAPVVPKPELPTTSEPKRFRFSKRPAWLERLLGGGGATAASASDVATQTADDDDFDFDFDDDDELPDWLDVDDKD